MFIDISNKRFVILGLQGTGKSYLVKYFLKNVRESIVYDVLQEHEGFNRFLVTYREYSDEALDELNTFISQVVIESKKIRLFILEEANRYCPNKRPLPEQVNQLNDFQRHWNIAFGSVARRASQLNTDLVELAHYLFIFSLQGKNDYEYLEAISEGLGDAVRALPDYHFVMVHPKRNYEVHKPITI